MNLVDMIVRKLMLLPQPTTILKRYYSKSGRFKALPASISFLSKIKEEPASNTDERNFKLENADWVSACEKKLLGQWFDTRPIPSNCRKNSIDKTSSFLIGTLSNASSRLARAAFCQFREIDDSKSDSGSAVEVSN